MKLSHIISSLGVFCLFLLAWEVVPQVAHVPRYIIPTASQTFNEFFLMIGRDNLLIHLLSTILMTALGFVIGSLFGATAGYLLGMSAFWERVLSPYLLALQIAPKVAFAPLFIMWFGYNYKPKLLVTVLIVFFPILVNVLQSMRTIDRDQINLARAYSMSRAQIFWKIEFPASMPSLMAGLRIGATLAVIGVTVGELVGGNAGRAGADIAQLCAAVLGIEIGLEFQRVPIRRTCFVTRHAAFDPLRQRLAVGYVHGFGAHLGESFD